MLTLPTGDVRSIRFDPTGRTLHVLAAGTTHPDLHSSLTRVDLASGEVIGRWGFGATHAVLAPDFRSLYFTRPSWESDRCHLRRLDLPTDREVVVYWTDDFHSGPLALTPNGHIMAIVSPFCRDDGYNPGLRRVDVWHGTRLDPIDLGPARLSVTCAAYSPDGDVLAAGGISGVRIWRGRSLVESYDTDPVPQLAWSPVGALAWAVESGVYVGRPGTPEPPWSVVLPERSLTALAFSPDGRLLVAASSMGACHVIDVGRGCVTAAFDWRIGSVSTVAFAPDGLTCAAGGKGGQVVLWDVDG